MLPVLNIFALWILDIQIDNIFFASQDESGKKSDSYVFKYVLPESAKKKDKGKEKDGKKGKSDDFDAFSEAVKDTKILWLSKLPADAKETQVRARILEPEWWTDD